MTNKIDKDGLIRKISEKARFNLGDTRIFLDSLVTVFEECLLDDIEIDVRGFGKLYVQTLPPRKGSKLVSNGKKLPKTKRVIFKLSKNIRDVVKLGGNL